MSTKIEWVRSPDGTQGVTWNPVTGCTKIAAGCKHCYAERMATRLRGRVGYPADDPFRVTLHPDRLEEPLRWRKPRMVFVCSMGDLFHQDVPESFIVRVFVVMARARRHTFQVLTKRPRRLHQIVEGWKRDGLTLNEGCTGRIPPNVWVGTSASTQKDLDANVAHLLSTPAAVRFVSFEPLIAPVDLDGVAIHAVTEWDEAAYENVEHSVDWVIVGGESGPRARPMHPQWARDIRDQCVAAGIPFFFKQWGEWAPGDSIESVGTAHHGWWETDACDGGVPNHDWPGPPWPIETSYRVGKKHAGRELDGRMWDEMPEVNRG